MTRKKQQQNDYYDDEDYYDNDWDPDKKLHRKDGGVRRHRNRIKNQMDYPNKNDREIQND